jgi:putative membrane protein
MRKLALISGIVALALAWSGLSARVAPGFTAHMIMHMLVVAVAAPLIALGITGTRLDPSSHAHFLFAPLPASLWELVAVWGWHAPALHLFARSSAAGLVLEQASFLAAGLILWLACVGARNAAAGVFGLLFTSMHMTLLGALLALAPRPLYEHAHHSLGITALEDQNLGGVVMLGVGGAVYLVGGLVLMARLLRGEEGTPCASL